MTEKTHHDTSPSPTGVASSGTRSATPRPSRSGGRCAGTLAPATGHLIPAPLSPLPSLPLPLPSRPAILKRVASASCTGCFATAARPSLFLGKTAAIVCKSHHTLTVTSLPRRSVTVMIASFRFMPSTLYHHARFSASCRFISFPRGGGVRNRVTRLSCCHICCFAGLQIPNADIPIP